MAENAQDRWAEWVLRRNPAQDLEHSSGSEFLRSLRDRVLDGAAVGEGDILLDVGCGDGLISFGALQRVGHRGRVIFSDISQNLLDHCRALAEEARVTDRCSFLQTPADDLSGIEDASVDVVTTRSVLIYVEDKRRSFEEFHRVLKPGGRLSIFEPINRFAHPEPPHHFLGYDVTPVEDLARKLHAVYERIQPPDDPMLDFDERDLFSLTESAGFEEVRLDYRAETYSGNYTGLEDLTWEKFLRSARNPKIPTPGEAMQEALTPEETERFAAHLRPLVESARRKGREAVAYLRAVKI